jgi:hypothetical protein
MDSQTIILPNDKAATYKVVTFIIAFMNLIFLGFIRYKETSPTAQFFLGFGLIWLLSSIVRYSFFKSSRKIIFIIIPLFVCSLIWLFMGFYVLGIISFLFSFFGFQANKPLKVKASKAGILYPTFPAKLFEWKEVEQVLIKDNVLTIDLKNNKLIQISISEQENEKLEHQAFNAFCNALIHQSK